MMASQTQSEPTVSSASGRTEHLAPVIAGVLLAIPTLLARYLPMSDLPMHEGVVGLLRHFGDPEYMPDGLYFLNLGHPNQLFHLTATLLSFAVSTSMAVKLVVAAAQIGTFVGGARLADYLGRSRWSVLLLAPLALGFTYYWGLVANLVGFAVFLLALPTIDRATREPSALGALKTSALLVLLFFAHESMFVCSALVIGVFTILQPLSWRKTALRIAPAVFAALVALGHLRWQAQFFTAAAVKAPVTFLTPWAKVHFFPNALFGSYDLVEQLILFGTAVVGIGLMATARRRERPEARAEAQATEVGTVSDHRLRRVRAKLYEHRFLLIGALHLLAYAVVPFNWNGATLVHERFLSPAWALLVITAAPGVDFPRIAKIVNAVVPAGILLVSWPQFLDADRAYRDLDALIARIPKNVAVTLVVLDRPLYRTRVYSASTGPARIIADRGGRMGLSLLMSPISPVQLRPEWRWDEYDRRRSVQGSNSFKLPHDLSRFGWVVGQSRDPFMRDLITGAFAPDADLVTSQGEWLLFHTRGQIGPLKSRDNPAPPDMDTVLSRVVDLQRQREEQRRGEGAPPPKPPEAD